MRDVNASAEQARVTFAARARVSWAAQRTQRNDFTAAVQV